jgi:hypothetical protein
MGTANINNIVANMESYVDQLNEQHGGQVKTAQQHAYVQQIANNFLQADGVASQLTGSAQLALIPSLGEDASDLLVQLMDNESTSSGITKSQITQGQELVAAFQNEMQHQLGATDPQFNNEDMATVGAKRGIDEFKASGGLGVLNAVTTNTPPTVYTPPIPGTPTGISPVGGNPYGAPGYPYGNPYGAANPYGVATPYGGIFPPTPTITPPGSPGQYPMYMTESATGGSSMPAAQGNTPPLTPPATPPTAAANANTAIPPLTLPGAAAPQTAAYPGAAPPAQPAAVPVQAAAAPAQPAAASWNPETAAANDPGLGAYDSLAQGTAVSTPAPGAMW